MAKYTFFLITIMSSGDVIVISTIHICSLIVVADTGKTWHKISHPLLVIYTKTVSLLDFVSIALEVTNSRVLLIFEIAHFLIYQDTNSLKN